MSKKYQVQQTFETFGHPAREVFDNEDDADVAADKLAEGIAECFYKRVMDNAVIEYYERGQHAGKCHEIDFHDKLSDDAGATEDKDGRMAWVDLVRRIYTAAVEIEEIETEEEKPTTKGTMNPHQQLAITTLDQSRSDNLYRARAMFRHRTPAQMQEQYGESGKTCAQILAEYEEHEAKVNAAIEWVKGVA